MGEKTVENIGLKIEKVEKLFEIHITISFIKLEMDKFSDWQYSFTDHQLESVNLPRFQLIGGYATLISLNYIYAPNLKTKTIIR